ncbi:MAG: response regulator [Ktedonobacterales bacterium]
MAERIIEVPMQEQRMSILVVEGSAAAQEHLRAALGEYYSLSFANGQAEALLAIRNTLPDLLVTELDLADGDGFDLCAHVRAQPRMQRLPIMVLTGRSAIQDKVAGFEAGADDYVVKPFDHRLFHARVRLLYRIKSMEKPA